MMDTDIQLSKDASVQHLTIYVVFSIYLCLKYHEHFSRGLFMTNISVEYSPSWWILVCRFRSGGLVLLDFRFNFWNIYSSVLCILCDVLPMLIGSTSACWFHLSISFHIFCSMSASIFKFISMDHPMYYSGIWLLLWWLLQVLVINT